MRCASFFLAMPFHYVHTIMDVYILLSQFSKNQRNPFLAIYYVCNSKLLKDNRDYLQDIGEINIILA